MIKSVLFDLDETLFDRHGTLQVFLADQFQRFGAELGSVDEPDWVETFLQADNRGKLPKRDLYPQLLMRFRGRTDIAPELIEDYYTRSVTNAVPMQGMDALLDELAARGIELGIITNGETRLQTQTLNALNLPDRVSAILISEQEGCRKPDREIFERALNALGAEARTSLFVGDDPVSDVLGAHRAGMRTAWFNRDERTWPLDAGPNPGVEISRLGEIMPLPE